MLFTTAFQNSTFSQWLPTTGSAYTCNAIFFPDTSTGYAVGVSLVKSIDGGNTWNSLNTPANEEDESIWFEDDNKGIVVGGISDDPIVKSTTDGGQNWKDITSPFLKNKANELFFLNIDTGFVVGDSGSISSTYNGGNTWNNVAYGGNANLNDLYFLGDSIGLVVGNSGTLYKTLDAGKNWSAINIQTMANLNSIHFVNKLVGYIAADSGYIFETFDAGQNWQILNSTTQENLYAIHFTNTDTGFCVGNNGTILKTIDGGINWQKQSSGTINKLNCTYARWSKLAVAAGENGTILKTTNGGELNSKINESLNADNSTVLFHREGNFLIIESKENVSLLELEIIDASGRKLISTTIKNSNHYSLNLNTLTISTGVYTISIIGKDFKKYAKYFIEK